uniref:Uncharacterized protein n=1 Tax=Monodon monoceros TaxID=40151 RepID=A0A8C6F3K7_MONMO
MTFCRLETCNKQGDFNSPRRLPTVTDFDRRLRGDAEENRQGHLHPILQALSRGPGRTPHVLLPTQIQTRRGTDLKVNQHS